MSDGYVTCSEYDLYTARCLEVIKAGSTPALDKLAEVASDFTHDLVGGIAHRSPGLAAGLAVALLLGEPEDVRGFVAVISAAMHLGYEMGKVQALEPVPDFSEYAKKDGAE